MQFKSIRPIPEIWLFWAMLFLSLGACATPEKVAAPVTQQITFEKNIHFLNDQAGDILVDAGSYTVRHAPNQTESIELVRPQPQGETSLVIDAVKGTHEETLAQPKVVSIGGEDLHYLALLVPEGIGYEVMGSYSGVWPRGGAGEIANRQVFQTALEKEGQTLEKLKQHILDLIQQGRLDFAAGANYLKDLRAHQVAISQDLTVIRTKDVKGLQSSMQMGSRAFQTLSAVIKSRHDIDTSLIRNIR